MQHLNRDPTGSRVSNRIGKAIVNKCTHYIADENPGQPPGFDIGQPPLRGLHVAMLIPTDNGNMNRSMDMYLWGPIDVYWPLLCSHAIEAERLKYLHVCCRA